MAFAERAELVARLSLKDDFTGKLKGATGAIKGMEGSLGRIATHANRGLRTAASNLGKIGVVAGGLVAVQVKAGLGSLAELEDAVTSVDGAIQQVGKGWKTTGAIVAAEANRIEESVQRAFDDKEITAATANLIRFGGVTEDNLSRAMMVMTDLAAKTGDVAGASSLLGKALADPTAAAGKLSRVGIVLTDQQQKQITTMVKAGKTAQAQAFLLGVLEKRTKGAAAASKGPYRDAMNILADVTEDAQRVLAEGFLPLLQRVADELSKSVSDPAFVQNVREFGQTLAGGFDKLLGIASRIPWDQIGTSLKIAGAGAKALFDAFTMMPPWVQTAVLTGWGLNKLTGGALGAIVGELGKGLIKGVLGMNAGVVNINAGVVKGGGVPIGGAAGAAKGGLSLLSKVFLVGEAIGLAVLVKEVADNVTAAAHDQSVGIHQVLTTALAGPQTSQELATKLAGINQGIANIQNLGNIPAGIFHETLVELETMRDETVAAIEALAKEEHKNLQPLPKKISQEQAAKFDRLRERTEANRIAIKSLETTTQNKVDQVRQAEQMVRERVEANRIATQTGLANVRTAEQAGTAAIVAAIRTYRAIVNVGVTVNSSGSSYQSNYLNSNKPKAPMV